MARRIPLVLARGHALLHEGAPHGSDRRRILAGAMLARGGRGRALCECMALSEELPTTAARKAWHRDHKAEVLARRQPDDQ